MDLLVRSGVRNLILWDSDRVEPNNLSRHICDLSDVGRKKVCAVRDHVLAVSPEAKVETVCSDVTASTSHDLLSKVVERSDCVVVGTDNNVSRFAVNAVAIDYGKPAYYGRAYARACGGDVVQVVPERGAPCYACHATRRGPVIEEVSSERDAERANPYSDRAGVIEPGLLIDIQPIANLIARLVLLQLLSKSASSSLRDTAAELDAALFMWANRRENPFDRRWPALLRWYPVRIPRDPNCRVCARRSNPFF